MFPNITRNMYKQDINTTINIVTRVVENSIKQNNNTSLQKNFTQKSQILKKEDIYKSLEKAYHDASGIK